MSGKIVNIAKNTSYFTLALILQKVISFGYFAVLASYLAPDDLGKYYFAISFAVVVGVFLDLGLGNVLVREVAKDKERAGVLLGGIILIKTPLLMLSLGTVAILTHMFGYDRLTTVLIYLSAVNVTLDSFAANFYAVIRGHHKLIYESIGHITFQLIVLIAGIFVLKSGLGLVWLMASLTLASLFGFFYSLFLLFFKFGLRLNFRQSVGPIWGLLVIALPFSLYAIMQRIFTYLDSVLLNNLSGEYYVGLYQIAFKIIFALQFLPMAFVASLYPAFASYWKRSRENQPNAAEGPIDYLRQLSVTFERAFSYLLMISTPIAVGIIFIARNIVTIFKPEYMDAVVPLQMIMVALPFLFLNYPVGALLNACDRPRVNTRNMGLTLAASIALNLFLIPRFNIYGASLTVVISNALLFALNFSAVNSVIDYNFARLTKMVLKVFMATVLMAIFLDISRNFINIIILVPIAAVIYFAVLFGVKAIRTEDIKSILQTFKRG